MKKVMEVSIFIILPNIGLYAGLCASVHHIWSLCRSELLHNFINELDRRSEKKNKKNNQPRSEQLGTADENQPSGLSRWMIKPGLVDQPELKENDSAKELFEDLANSEVDSNISIPSPTENNWLLLFLIVNYY